MAAIAVLALPATGARLGGRGSQISSIFAGQTVSGAAIPCTAQSDGTRVCHGTYDNGTGGTDLRLKSFDGSRCSLYLTLPPAPARAATAPTR